MKKLVSFFWAIHRDLRVMDSCCPSTGVRRRFPIVASFLRCDPMWRLPPPVLRLLGWVGIARYRLIVVFAVVVRFRRVLLLRANPRFSLGRDKRR